MILRMLSVLLLLLAAPLYAADAEAPAADTTESEDASDTAAIEAEDPALAEEIRAAEEQAANVPAADPNEPFVPTVQISEDLSVSFPVDI